MVIHARLDKLQKMEEGDGGGDGKNKKSHLHAFNMQQQHPHSQIPFSERVH